MVSIHTVITIRAYVHVACMGPVFVIVMSVFVCVTEIRHMAELKLESEAATERKRRRKQKRAIEAVDGEDLRGVIDFMQAEGML